MKLISNFKKSIAACVGLSSLAFGPILPSNANSGLGFYVGPLTVAANVAEAKGVKNGFGLFGWRDKKTPTNDKKPVSTENKAPLAKETPRSEIKERAKLQVMEDPGLFIGNKSCSLGSIVVLYENGTLQCVTPTENQLNFESGSCSKDGWVRPNGNYNKTKTALGLKVNDDSKLKASEVTPNGLNPEDAGVVGVVLSSLEGGLAVKQTEVGGKFQRIDLVASIQIGYSELTEEQSGCYAVQTTSDLKERFHLGNKDEIKGFVSKITLGYAHAVTLVDVQVEAKQGTLIELSAGNITASALVRGSIADTYMSTFEAFLETDLVGKEATINATKLARMSSKVTSTAALYATVVPLGK
jgi:hypothetical protein